MFACNKSSLSPEIYETECEHFFMKRNYMNAVPSLLRIIFWTLILGFIEFMQIKKWREKKYTWEVKILEGGQKRRKLFLHGINSVLLWSESRPAPPSLRQGRVPPNPSEASRAGAAGDHTPARSPSSRLHFYLFILFPVSLLCGQTPSLQTRTSYHATAKKTFPRVGSDLPLLLFLISAHSWKRCFKSSLCVQLPLLFKNVALGRLGIKFF